MSINPMLTYLIFREENAKNAKMLDEYFLNGEEIYKGYVDDPRYCNTRRP